VAEVEGEDDSKDELGDAFIALLVDIDKEVAKE
jgi:hypothetical protein